MPFSRTDDVKASLGPYLDTTNDLTNEHIAAMIARVDHRILSKLGGVFSRFNELADSPQTPGTIQDISRHLAIAEGLRQIGATGNPGASRDAEDHELVANTLLADIMESPEKWMRLETVASELLTFGTEDGLDWTPGAYDAFLADSDPAPIVSGEMPSIVANTVRIVTATITGSSFDLAQLLRMRSGVEFSIHPSPGHRKWIFRADEPRLVSEITNGTLAVAYDWSYLRPAGASVDPADSGDGVLIGQWD